MLGNYSIKELEMLTGIKAHTIRIWEQRYNILNPNRTETNIRYYTEGDLKHLLNISLLNKSGYKISHIARMSEQQVREIVLTLSENNFEYATQIDSLVLSMIEFDEDGFEKIIATNILRIGFEKTFLYIVFPFLNKIGLLWQTAVIRPAQEHFISNLIRQKLIVAIDGQIMQKVDNPRKYMLFLPEKELHEHSLLFINYIIRSRGNHTLYLGASVPLDDVETTFADYRPDYMLTLCIAYPGDNYVQEYANALAERFPDTPIILSGRLALGTELSLAPNLMLMDDIMSAIEFVEVHSSQSNSGNSGGITRWTRNSSGNRRSTFIRHNN